MKSASAIFFLAKAPFWFSIFPDNENVSIVRIDELPLKNNGTATIPSSKLNISSLNRSGANYFDVYQDKKIIVIAPRKKLNFPSFLERFWTELSFKPDSISLLSAHGKASSERFRNKTKTQLIQEISHTHSPETIDNILAAFRKYTFFESVSAWLYNDITDVFTRLAGDIKASNNYISSDHCKILKTALSGPDITQLDTSSNYDVPDILPTTHQWVNVLRIETKGVFGQEKGITSVICMYSKHLEYNLRDTTKQLIISFFQQALAARYFDRFKKLTSLMEKIRPQISLVSLKPFLSGVAESVCSTLSWESCVIFLQSKSHPDILELIASYPHQNISSLQPHRSYDINKAGLTPLVFRENKTKYSYDIKADPRNSHIINDIPKSKPRNWIGVPISLAAEMPPIGVLRVKNKILSNPADDPHFSSLDMKMLQVLSSEIASILSHAEILAERERTLKKRALELSELSEFLRSFRHEIRSPIQSICFAPDRIRTIIKDEDSITHAHFPKKLRECLDDFEATANRLEMISKALTLDPEEIVKEFERKNLFKDCIAPVLAFEIPYAYKKQRYMHINKDSLLINAMCDAVSISMAFHVVIDNAIKYSDKNERIEVFGEIIPAGYQVVVKSKSRIFEILGDEVNCIYQKYYRGSIAKQQKLEGSGIGLYLAKKIMELNKGDLILLKPKNPVTFALRFPKVENYYENSVD